MPRTERSPEERPQDKPSTVAGWCQTFAWKGTARPRGSLVPCRHAKFTISVF